jgi:hypothetical protein
VAANRNIDPQKLKEKYAEERNKRLNSAAGRKYTLAKDDSKPCMQDLWSKSQIDRPPLNEEIDVLVVGGGMSGIMTAVRLMQNGVTDIRLLERGGDFGGTWYWNQYPGAACDTESSIYMPFLDDTGYVPTEKYAGQPELQSYLKALANQMGVTPHALFNTKAQTITWNEDGSCDRIEMTNSARVSSLFVPAPFLNRRVQQSKEPGHSRAECFSTRAGITDTPADRRPIPNW